MPFLSDWKYPEITHLFSKYRYFLLSLYVVSLSYWVFLSSLQHPNKNQLKESHSTAGTPENRLLWKLEWGVKQMYFSSQIIQTLPLKCVAGENPYLDGECIVIDSHCFTEGLKENSLELTLPDNALCPCYQWGKQHFWNSASLGWGHCLPWLLLWDLSDKIWVT